MVLEGTKRSSCNRSTAANGRCSCGACWR